MAPKKADAVAITPATIANGLVGDSAQQLTALGQLATPAAAAYSQADILAAGIPEKLVDLIRQQQDKSVKLLSCRLLAGYAAGTGQLQQAVTTQETLQALWSVLVNYQATESAITTLLADPAAVKAATAAKKAAGADPDDWLPGPSKYLLEAVLRAVCSLLSSTGSAGQEAAADTPAVSHGSDALGLISWAEDQYSAVVVCLLRHPSVRVQTRAARLAFLLAKSSGWADSFTAAKGVHAAMQVLFNCSSTATAAGHKTGEQSTVAVLQLTVLRLLLRLAGCSAVATAVMAREKQLMDMLMQQLLDAGAVVAAVAAPGKGKPAAEKSTSESKGLTAVQQAAADLLAFLCSRSSSMSEQLVQAGGLAVLQQLLPDPPIWHDTAAGDIVGEAQQSVEEPATAAGRQQTTSRHPTPRGAPAAARPTTPKAAAAAGTATATPRPEGEAAASTQGPSLTPGGYPPPAGKLQQPELQAKALQVFAAVLSQPSLLQSVLQPSASLPRLLLHLFAAAPAPPPTAEALETATSLSGAAKGAGAAAKGAAGAAAAAGGPPRRSGIGAVQEPAATAAAAGGGGGSSTPRKGTAAGQKVSESQDPLVPPFPLITKAAALECLAQMVQDKQAVALLAQQEVQLPSIRGNTASRPGTSAGQQQQQQTDGHQISSYSSISMLHQMLQDVQQMLAAGTSGSATVVSGDNQDGNDSTVGSDAQPATAADSGEQQVPAASMTNAAADVLAGLAEHLDKEQLQQLPVLRTLKVLAKCAATHKQQTSVSAQHAIARALLMLPEELYVAPARPPLPSPPQTPPPPPLPTSQFAWDALGRPFITDGAVLASNA